MSQRPLEIEAAKSALEVLSSELSDNYKAYLQNALPQLARKMAQAGEVMDAEGFVEHIRKGKDHLDDLKKEYNKPPKETIEAFSALKMLAPELKKDQQVALKKALPALARQMAQADEDVNADILVAHVRKGEEHLATLKEQYSQKPKEEVLTYDAVVSSFSSQTNQIEGLLKAVRNGDYDEIKRIGLTSQEHFFHVIHEAVHEGDLEMVKFLSKCDTDKFDQHFMSHLNREIHLAAEKGHLEIIKFLLKEDVHITSNTYDPISAAFRGKQQDVLHFLISCGKYDDYSNLNVMLRNASMYGFYDVVELLIEKGADVGTDWDDAMELSLGNGHWDVAYLLQKHGSDITNTYERILMTALAKSGGTKEIKILRDAFPDFNLMELFAQSIANGNIDVIQYCLDEGVDYKDFNYTRKNKGTTTSYPGNNVLMAAVRDNQKEVCLFFKEYDHEFYQENLTGALAISGQEKHAEMTKFLVEEGANASDPNLWILRDYICEDDIETVKFLISHGADVTAHDNMALREACRGGKLSFTKLLVENGAKAFDPAPAEVGDSWWGDRIAVTDYLLEQRILNWPLTEIQQKKLSRYRDWNTKFPDMTIPEAFANVHYYHFDSETYKAVTDMLKKEGYDRAEGYAYNVSCLFKSEQRVLQYLQKWGDAGKQPLHDIIQDIIVPREGRPDLKAWGDAVLKHGPKMAKFVKFSDRLPQPIKDRSGGWSYAKTKEEIAKHAFKRGNENPKLATFCLDHAWDDDDYEDALKQIKKFRKRYKLADLPEAANDNIKGGAIPDITIDGAEFGKDGYTFRKLPDGDIRGLLLGEFTNCCQHLANAGRDCAKHGFLSENGGFYIVEDDKTGGIVGQTWAWRGMQGELVFDSLESLSGHFNAEKWSSLCRVFSEKIKATLPDSGITAFHVGKGGATPDRMGFEKPSQTAKPADYSGYRDSENQYRIMAY